MKKKQFERDSKGRVELNLANISKMNSFEYLRYAAGWRALVPASRPKLSGFFDATAYLYHVIVYILQFTPLIVFYWIGALLYAHVQLKECNKYIAECKKGRLFL